MPREKIDGTDGCFNAQVGWGRDTGDVQIGVEMADGQQTLRSVADFSSVWASLDRAGVNRLIRALRRARDQAFGRDE